MKRALMCFLVVLFSKGAVAGGMVAGATEPTQIANNIQLLLSYMEQAQQTITQANQYATMLRNLKQMTPSSALNVASSQLWRNQDMNSNFKSLYQIVNGTQRIVYNSKNLDGQLKSMGPSYGDALSGVDLQKEYKKWSGMTTGIVQDALQATTIQAENLETEDQLVNELNNAAQSADGQMQALGAANQIGIAMMGQMQKLRQLQMTQMKAQNMVEYAKQAKSDQSDELTRKMFTAKCKRLQSMDEIKRKVPCSS